MNSPCKTCLLGSSLLVLSLLLIPVTCSADLPTWLTESVGRRELARVERINVSEFDDDGPMLRRDVESLDGIEQLTELRHASLMIAGLEDLTPLARLPRLETLHLAIGKATPDFNAPGLLPQLRELRLGASMVKNLDWVANLPHLRHLEVFCLS